MATVLGTLAVKLSAKTSAFSRAMAAASKSLDTFGAASKKVAKVAGLGFAAFAGTIAAITRTTSQFEGQMARTAAIVTGGAEGMNEVFSTLGARAIEVAGKSKFMGKEVAEGMQFMAQAGATAQQIFEGIGDVTTLAAAGGIELGKAADIATNVMAGFRLETAELAKVSDILVSATTGANVNIEQMGEAMKFAGPVAASAGIQIEEAAAAIALMGNAGIQGGMAGTSLRTAIARLIKPTAQVETTMKKMGVRVKNSEGRMRSLTAIMADLQPHANDTAKIMEIFGLRAGPAMAALLGQGSDALAKFTARLQASGGVAERIAKAQLNTFGGQMDILRSQVESFTIQIGQAMLPALRAFVGELQSGVSFMQGLSSGTKRTIASLLLAGTAITGIVTGLALFGAALPKLKAGLITMLPILGAIALKLGIMAVAIAAALPLLASLAVVFDELGPDAVDAMRAAFQAIANMGVAAFDGVKRVAARSFGSISGFGGTLASFLSKVLSAGLETPFKKGKVESSSFFAELTVIGSKVASKLGRDFRTALGVIKDFFITTPLEFWQKKVKKALGEVKELFTELDDSIKESFDFKTPVFEEGITPTIDVIAAVRTPKIEKAFDDILLQAFLARDRMKQVPTIFGFFIKSLGQKLLGALGELGSIIDAFGEAGLAGGLAEISFQLISRSKAFKVIVETFGEFLDRISPIIDALTLAVLGLLLTLANFFDNTIGKLLDIDIDTGLLENTIDRIRERIAEPLTEAIPEAFADTIDGLEDFNDALTDVTEAAEQLTNVPEGFRVALARFEASIPEMGGGFGTPVDLTAGGGRSTVFNIGELNVESATPEKTAELLINELERRAFVTKGTPISSTSPFALPLQGG